MTGNLRSDEWNGRHEKDIILVKVVLTMDSCFLCPIAMVNLHAAGRWIQRNSNVTRENFFADLEYLIDHNCQDPEASFIPASNGNWFGQFIDLNMKKYETSFPKGHIGKTFNVRTYY